MKISIILSFLLLLNMNVYSQNKNQFSIDLLLEYIELKYPNNIFNNFIYIGIKRQELFLINNKEVTVNYKISTSKYGVGNIDDSEKTPLGLHKIYKMYGKNVPICGIFISKKYINKITTIESLPKNTNTDIICSRIITIKGLEEGLNIGDNIDSYLRNIYIHGTNEEGLIGTPSSHGCIRMKNIEIIDLYTKIFPEMLIVILDN